MEKNTRTKQLCVSKNEGGSIDMAGHSKWSNIKHRKERVDAKRGKIFTKIGRELAVAVKTGGPDPENNSRLADVVAKAKANNMPNDSITRSIKKAAGDVDTSTYEDIVYEGYGPAGVAVIVEAMTDNRNRTAAEVRHSFDRCGGNLGTSGCVSFMFDKKGVIIIDAQTVKDADELMMDALDAGAEDFSEDDGVYEVLTSTEDYSKIRSALESKDYSFASAGIEMIPQTRASIDDPKQVALMEKLIDLLEDNDDVMEIYHNLNQED